MRFRETSDIAWRFTIQEVVARETWSADVDNGVPKNIETAQTAIIDPRVV
jgi:hypothetical protein